MITIQTGPRVTLQYDEPSGKWIILVSGCKDELEAKQCFNAAILTTREVVVTLEHRVTPTMIVRENEPVSEGYYIKPQPVTEGYYVEPAVTLLGMHQSGVKHL